MIRILTWVLFLFGGGAIAIWLDKHWFPYIFSNLYFHSATFIIGVVVLKLVMRASKNTGRILAKFGREGVVPRLETNRLITKDIYSCMRHPMHFGLLLFPLSVALILGSPTFIIFIAPAEIVIIILMIKYLEEPQAIRKFGQDYINYKKEVPFFSFKLKHLRKLFGKTIR